MICCSYGVYVFLYVQVTVCKIIRNEKNEIARDRKSDNIALMMGPDTDHGSVVSKAESALGLNPNKCSLVRLSGLKIRNEKNH